LTYPNFQTTYVSSLPIINANHYAWTEGIEMSWIIIEAKATVKDEDISDHSKVSKAIYEIYQKDSELWKYELRFQTWLVACYGWDDYLKGHAKREGIIPIDRQDLENRIGKHNLLDRGRPPCPKQ